MSLTALQQLAADDDWWAEQGEAAKRAVLPHVLEAVAEGVQLALAAAGARVVKELMITEEQREEIRRILDAVVADYLDSWWEALAETRRTRLRELINEAIATGQQPRWVAKKLVESGLYSKTQAMAIAVTETTRIVGLASQTTYRALGFEGWVWNTAMDDLVCLTCGPLNGREFPMEESFSPAHVRCRCFVAPSVPLQAAA